MTGRLRASLQGSSAALLARAAGGEVDGAVDAEGGRTVYDLIRRIVVRVLPITGEVTDLARRLLDGHKALMARDALHEESAG